MLFPSMNDLTGMTSAFQQRLDALARELPGVEEGNVGALHRARVASRRLRELLPLLPLDRSTNRKLARRLKKVTRTLGVVRELDVLGLLLDELRRDGRCAPAALEQVGASVADARLEARARLIGKRRIAKLSKLIARLRRASQAVEDDGTNERRSGESRPAHARRWVLEARVASRAARVRAALEHAGPVYAAGQLHDLRIALKKLRYAAELSDDGGSGRLTADIAMLRAGQDLLGRLHDLEVLLSWARDVQASLSPPDLRIWRALGTMAHTIEDDCRRLHAHAMRDASKLMAVANRFGAGRPAALPSREAIG